MQPVVYFNAVKSKAFDFSQRVKDGHFEKQKTTNLQRSPVSHKR
jgi:hypothetical protein